MKNLHAWDGREGGGGYIYDVIAAPFLYWIDGRGTVYYTPREGGDPIIWCPAKDLQRHLRRLDQLKARSDSYFRFVAARRAADPL